MPLFSVLIASTACHFYALPIHASLAKNQMKKLSTKAVTRPQQSRFRQIYWVKCGASFCYVYATQTDHPFSWKKFHLRYVITALMRCFLPSNMISRKKKQSPKGRTIFSSLSTAAFDCKFWNLTFSHRKHVMTATCLHWSQYCRYILHTFCVAFVSLYSHADRNIIA